MLLISTNIYYFYIDIFIPMYLSKSSDISFNDWWNRWLWNTPQEIARNITMYIEEYLDITAPLESTIPLVRRIDTLTPSIRKLVAEVLVRSVAKWENSLEAGLAKDLFEQYL